jgi:hypothetical protein
MDGKWEERPVLWLLVAPTWQEPKLYLAAFTHSGTRHITVSSCSRWMEGRDMAEITRCGYLYMIRVPAGITLPDDYGRHDSYPTSVVHVEMLDQD